MSARRGVAAVGDRTSPGHRARAYVVAGGATVVAVVLARLVYPVLEPTMSPLFFAAVVVTAWYGGFGPALFTTALAVVGKTYFFVSPRQSLWIDDIAAGLQLGLFVVIAFLVSSVMSALREAEAENRALAAHERAARAEAEAANRAKDLFLAKVTHELRTPLQAISTWLEVLRRRRPEDPEMAQALDALQHGVNMQRRLVADLVDIARIIGGKLPLDVEPVDLPAVLETAVKMATAARADGESRVCVLIDPSPGPVLGDRSRLEQVVANLVSNALKFTPAEGRVEVRLQRAAARARIIVEDTGCGIPDDVLPHVFDEFRQGPGAGTSADEGLGLGLAIVRHLVELHGGTVRAESRGAGARFIVELPLAGGEVAHAQRRARSAVVLGHPGGGSGGP
jgi:signal transduction histidine kinase